MPLQITPVFRETAWSAAAAAARRTALIIVDVQDSFCGPAHPCGNKETDKIAQRIANIAPIFRRAGVQIYAVYYDHFNNCDPIRAGFYKFAPALEDFKFSKRHDSAFRMRDGRPSAELPEILRKRGHEQLLICGVNLNACVKDTAIDARKAGFAVDLLYDLSANGKLIASSTSGAVAAMTAEGVVISHWDGAYRALGMGPGV